MNTITKTRILGLNFFNGTASEVVQFLKLGGLLVVPSAPALVKISEDPNYYESLHSADIIIPDSGFMSLIWNLRAKQKINRISGLAFLKTFFNDAEVKESKTLFLVNPSLEESKANIAWLNQSGIGASEDLSYIAPMYRQPVIEDEELLMKLEVAKPDYIVINLGGGIQEKLGSYLKKNLSYSPAIICTGAAIAFLTGKQARIPKWIDRLYMGWLLRCFENPAVFVPRYFSAFKLARMMMTEKYSAA